MVNCPPPNSKARTCFGLFHVCRVRQFWRDFADLPRERHPSHSPGFSPSRPLRSPVFSSGLASVREVTSRIGAGFVAVGCARKVVTASDRRMETRQIFRGHDLAATCVQRQTFKGLLNSEIHRMGKFTWTA